MLPDLARQLVHRQADFLQAAYDFFRTSCVVFGVHDLCNHERVFWRHLLCEDFENTPHCRSLNHIVRVLLLCRQTGGILDHLDNLLE